MIRRQSDHPVKQLMTHRTKDKFQHSWTHGWPEWFINLSRTIAYVDYSFNHDSSLSNLFYHEMNLKLIQLKFPFRNISFNRYNFTPDLEFYELIISQSFLRFDFYYDIRINSIQFYHFCKFDIIESPNDQIDCLFIPL